VAGAGFDFAVCGSSPFAMLLAGLLATAHGKRVCLVGEPWSPYRLPRRLDVSVQPATRPETWALLKQSGAEAAKLLGSIGRGLYERVDPLFVAETRATADYLAHMRWVALGLGIAAERAAEPGLTANGTVCRIRDAVMLVGGKAEPAIEAWLQDAGVSLIRASSAAFAQRRDGTATIRAGSDVVEAAAVVLADDAAILERLPAGDRHRALTVSAGIGVLAEPQKPQTAVMIQYLDRDIVVYQRALKGPVLALAGGEAESALARVGASLADRARRTGQSIFRHVGTSDGAPLMGRMGKGRMIVIAGLGACAAFLAPAVARMLADAASAEERAYFEARDAARGPGRQAVADAVPTQALEPQP
jgi:hypothetical protein